MSYIAGEERGQETFLPARLDDYVRDDAPVRVIDAFVDRLAVGALGFGRPAPAATGRPGYDPRDLLKLYVWGYLNEVRSSRRLERECGRNVEAMWLLRRLSPDFKTIADFRRDNGAAIVASCRAFVLFCRDQGLFAARLLALDGSKFRAAASLRRIVSARKLAEQAAELDRRIAGYLAELEAADAAEPEEASRAATLAALDVLKARRGAVAAKAAELEAAGRQTLVEGEPEARPMGIGRGPKPPCYNVQTAVDAETSLIVNHDVTTETNDTRMLHPMAKAAKDALGLETLVVVADGGFSNGTGAALCEADGITPCVPANRSVNNSGDGKLLDRSAFAYEAASDSYRCPAGRRLVRKRRIAHEQSVQYMAAEDCSGCALKPRCTTAARRSLQRHDHENALERMDARVAADPDLMRQRRCAVEHPFGTIKRMMGGGRFLTRGLDKVKTETALSVLAYNMRRSVNIVGGAFLLAALA